MAKPTFTSGAGFEAKQPVRLETSLYGAMFARYSPAKDKEFKGDKVNCTPVSFVVTHNAAGKQLPKFSEAFAMVPNKIFFDLKTGKRSKMVEFLAAILGGAKQKMTAEDLMNHQDKIPDFDELIGYPIALLIEPSVKQNANGIYYNNIKQYVQPAKELMDAVRSLYKTAVFDVNKQSGYKYLVEPKAVFEEGAATPGPKGTPTANESLSAEEKALEELLSELPETSIDDEIPF